MECRQTSCRLEDGRQRRKVAGSYEQILVAIFSERYSPMRQAFQARDKPNSDPLPDLVFDRDDIIATAERLGLARPKNVGDLIYSYRYRKPLPKEILATEPEDYAWRILGAGSGRYKFQLRKQIDLIPRQGAEVRKIPDATPEIVGQYALGDEQGLLARVRYNRLIDIFLGLTAYSLQNHLRTSVQDYGQIEIDELYVGVDAAARQYVIPVQAKRANDSLGDIQTIQDAEFCRTHERYKRCLVRQVSAQFLPDGTIALFELKWDGRDVSVVQERHYRLVGASQISDEDLSGYGVD